jgi:hypothetical protein
VKQAVQVGSTLMTTRHIRHDDHFALDDDEHPHRANEHVADSRRCALPARHRGSCHFFRGRENNQTPPGPTPQRLQWGPPPG